jgi:zona occludens toxin (predicted ATPase)
MATHVHTGVPGSGKTYLLVANFCREFCAWSKDEQRYLLKPVKPGGKPIRVISNIDGLVLDHDNLDELMIQRCRALARRKVVEQTGGNIDDGFLEKLDDVAELYFEEYYKEKVRWFFTDEYQMALAASHQIVYLIEECQRYFDTAELGRASWVRNTLYFFERHRHHGISMYLDTQNIKKIHAGIVAVVESELRAKPRTMSIAGEMRYNRFVEGVKVNQVPIVEKPSKRIRAMYQSFTATEAGKLDKPLKKLAIGVCVVSLISFGMYRYTIGKFRAKAESQTQTVDAKKADVHEKQAPLSQQKEWVSLSHVLFGDGSVSVIHPMTGQMIPLQAMDLPYELRGTTIYAEVDAVAKDESFEREAMAKVATKRIPNEEIVR